MAQMKVFLRKDIVYKENNSVTKHANFLSTMISSIGRVLDFNWQKLNLGFIFSCFALLYWLGDRILPIFIISNLKAMNWEQTEVFEFQN